MKAYRDRFQQHPLQASLHELWDSIEKTSLPKIAEGDAPEDLSVLIARRNAFSRFLRVASFVARTIDHTDATIWTPSALSAAESAVSHLKNGLTQFKSTNAVTHLETGADNALDQFRTAFIPRLALHSTETADSFLKFCEKAEETVRSLEETDLAIKAKELEISKSKADFSVKLESLQSQLDGYKAEFEAQKARVDTLVTSQAEAFQTSQTERGNLFTQEAETRKLSFEQWTKNADDKLKATLDATKTAADKHLQEMEQQKARAKEILGIVASSGVSGHYQKTADREFWSAEILRGVALLFFLGMIGLVTYVVFTLKSGDKFEWQMGLFRVGVGLALLAPAYYCTRESSKHREAEKRNRRLQIELATIEPYLENLNDVAERQAIFKQKAEGYFLGQMHKEPSDGNDGDLNSKEFKQIQAQVMDLLKAALTAAVKK
jgi:hypothetical protein